MKYPTALLLTLGVFLICATPEPHAKIVPATYNAINVYVTNQTKVCAYVIVSYKRGSLPWTDSGKNWVDVGRDRMFNVSTPLGSSKIRVHSAFLTTEQCSSPVVARVDSPVSGNVPIPKSGTGRVRSFLTGSKGHYAVSIPQ